MSCIGIARTPGLAKPNSTACFIKFTVSAPPVAKVITDALLCCAWSRKELKSLVPNGAELRKHADNASPNWFAREIHAHAHDALANVKAHSCFLLIAGFGLPENRGESLSAMRRRTLARWMWRLCCNDDGDADGYGRRIVTIADDDGWPTWWQEPLPRAWSLALRHPF
jgi:hypothetical protein